MGASGRSAQIGFKNEGTVGTAATVDHFVEFNTETLAYAPTELQGQGLRASGIYARDSRRVRSRHSAGGSVEMDFSTNTMGLLLKHALGAVSGPTQQSSTTAYKSIFTPADTTGLGLTWQVGRPQTDGTVKPFTYNGGKITGWTISVSDNEIAKLSVDLDFWNQTTATALASASYTAAAEVFTFADVSVFTLGGTVSTTSGLASVSGGTSVATVCKGFSLTGSTPSAMERFGLGNSGVKKEQVENDWRTLTGTLDAEFTDQSEFYDLFAADTTTAVQLTFVGYLIDTGQNATLDIILPAVRFTNVAPQVGGPDLVAQSVEFEVLDDGTNAPVQIVTISSDTAL